MVKGKMTRNEKIIWAAGFLDGEAYVGITRSRYIERDPDRWFHREQLCVGQVKREPLDLLEELFGGSVSKSKDKYGSHFQWRVYGKKAVAAVKEVLPYLLVKRTQAVLMIEFSEQKGKLNRKDCGQFGTMDVETYLVREQLHATMMTLNRRRERLSEDAPTGNTEGDAIVRPHGNNNHESEAEMSSPLVD